MCTLLLSRYLFSMTNPWRSSCRVPLFSQKHIFKDTTVRVELPRCRQKWTIPLHIMTHVIFTGRESVRSKNSEPFKTGPTNGPLGGMYFQLGSARGQKETPTKLILTDRTTLVCSDVSFKWIQPVAIKCCCYDHLLTIFFFFLQLKASFPAADLLKRTPPFLLRQSPTGNISAILMLTMSMSNCNNILLETREAFLASSKGQRYCHRMWGLTLKSQCDAELIISNQSHWIWNLIKGQLSFSAAHFKQLGSPRRDRIIWIIQTLGSTKTPHCTTFSFTKFPSSSLL